VHGVGQGADGHLVTKRSQAAKKMENPTTRGPIENAAKRYAQLFEKFEAARIQISLKVRGDA
jgi:hypothetical protein